MLEYGQKRLETLAEIQEVKAKELGTFSAEASLHKIAATEYKKLAKHYTTQRDLWDSNRKEKKSNEVSVSLPTLSRHLLDNKRNGDNFKGQVIEAQILLWEEQYGCYIAKALDEVAGTAAWLKSSYKLLNWARVRQQLLVEGEDGLLMTVLNEVREELNITPRVIKSWIAMYPERYVKGYTNKFDELHVGEEHEQQVMIDLGNLKTVTPLHLRIYIRDILEAMTFSSAGPCIVPRIWNSCERYGGDNEPLRPSVYAENRYY